MSSLEVSVVSSLEVSVVSSLEVSVVDVAVVVLEVAWVGVL